MPEGIYARAAKIEMNPILAAGIAECIRDFAVLS